MTRPGCIKNYREIQQPDDCTYPGSPELLSVGAPLAKALGRTKIGIRVETLPPGRRTSWPHCESLKEEFAFVLEGAPDVWLDGHLHRLAPGDAVGFKAGTGLVHTFINNTASDVRLLVVGEPNKPENKIYYPLNPERKAQSSLGIVVHA